MDSNGISLSLEGQQTNETTITLDLEPTPFEIHDEWSTIIELALVFWSPFIPIIEFSNRKLSQKHKNMIRCIQIILATILASLSIGYSVVLLIKLLDEEEESERRWSGLLIIVLFIYLTSVLLKLWVKRDKMYELIIGYKFNKNFAINVYSDNGFNSIINKVRSYMKKERLTNPNINRALKFIFGLFLIIITNFIEFGLNT